MTMIKVAGATEFSNCTCTKCDGTDGTTTVVSGGITITCPPVSEIYGQSPNLIDPNLAAFNFSAAQPSPQPSSSLTDGYIGLGMWQQFSDCSAGGKPALIFTESAQGSGNAVGTRDKIPVGKLNACIPNPLVTSSTQYMIVTACTPGTSYGKFLGFTLLLCWTRHLI
jgi:hypothetical protein